jgi:hypothetical protein
MFVAVMSSKGRERRGRKDKTRRNEKNRDVWSAFEFWVLQTGGGWL